MTAVLSVQKVLCPKSSNRNIQSIYSTERIIFMKFRPCIDIHNGKVKQIVGSSLTDQNDAAAENFVSKISAADHARRYTELGLTGGHIILLNPVSSPYYNATHAQAVSALQAVPGRFQVGGGINPENASGFLDAGASHVIVTSYVFSGGEINRENLFKIESAVGREHLVLDLSCGKKDGEYRIVTDRWQKYSSEILTPALLVEMASHCDEFLVHAINVEGKSKGPDIGLIELLSTVRDIPVTYAGGIGSLDDIRLLRDISGGHLDFTIGSALTLFGGTLELQEVLEMCEESDP